jgi:hypothetical protein
MAAVGSSSGAKGLMPMAKSLVKGMTYKKGAAVAAGVVGARTLMGRRKSGLDKMPGRPTGIRNY